MTDAVIAAFTPNGTKVTAPSRTVDAGTLSHGDLGRFLELRVDMSGDPIRIEGRLKFIITRRDQVTLKVGFTEVFVRPSHKITIREVA